MPKTVDPRWNRCVLETFSEKNAEISLHVQFEFDEIHALYLKGMHVDKLMWKYYWFVLCQNGLKYFWFKHFARVVNYRIVLLLKDALLLFLWNRQIINLKPFKPASESKYLGNGFNVKNGKGCEKIINFVVEVYIRMDDMDLKYLYILWKRLEMLAKSTISISLEICENIVNIYIIRYNIQLSENTATKDLRTQEGITCNLNVNCKFSWMYKITRNFKWNHFEKNKFEIYWDMSSMHMELC